jgi:2-phospho-L-lactate guanylyltransferase
VPYKGPVGSKRRLAPLLSDDERARLSLAMLDDVLDALLEVAEIERALLLTPWERGLPARPGRRSGQDGRAPRGTVDERLTIVGETPGPNGVAGHDNLNGALRQAQGLAQHGGADALLIVPADLPLVSAEDVGAVLDAGRTASVAIAPDRAGDGTNALLLSPPNAIEPGFGLASFSRHRALADAAGKRTSAVERPGLALDLDTPADVEILLASGRECRAVRLLHELDVARRLESLASSQARSTTI